MGRDEELFDLYLDACLAGRGEPPDAFLARHPDADAALRPRLESLFRMLDDGKAARVEPAAVEAGLPRERVGEFRLVRRLGAGGMGELYLAEQAPLGRLVALKLIRPELLASPTAVERFRREALAVARLNHPGIVGIHACGEDDGVLYIAMELVPGKNLSDVIREAAAAGRALPPGRAAAWIRDLARAAQHAHEQGVVHRDIKPGNVRITPQGTPRLLDFGVARDERWRGRTVTEAFAGSPLYAAPEQLAGRGVDARSDVYALGVTLYQCLTGRVPFEGGTLEDQLRRVLTEEPLPPRRLSPAVPRDLEVIALKAMEKDPARRYASAGGLADDLDAFLQGRPIRARRAGPLLRAMKWARRRPAAAAVLATVVLAAAVGGGLYLARAREEANRRRAEAREALDAARDRVAGFRANREARAAAEWKVAQLIEQMHAQYTSAEEDRLLEENEDAVAAARRDREAVFYEVLDLLRNAERLDPGAADAAEEIRAELYVEKWREARTMRDPGAEAFYAALAARNDRTGRMQATLAPVSTLDLDTEPSGAEAFLYRYREQAEVVSGGEHRLVPVPFGEPLAEPAPGARVLRVVVGAGDLVPGDLVLAVAGQPTDAILATADEGPVRRNDRLVAAGGRPLRDAWDLESMPPSPEGLDLAFERAGGERAALHVASTAAAAGMLALAAVVAEGGGVPARVFRNGCVEEVDLPPGLEVRETAAPLPVCAGARIGTTPLRHPVPEGDYVLLLHRPGCEDQRHAFLARSGEGFRLRVPLAAAGTVPRGFVRVLAPAGPVLVMEREVTCAEYLRFLNDPPTLARLGRPGEPDLVPRVAGRPLWERGADGRFVLPHDWRTDWPVLGVSWDDATAYAAWRGAAEGRRYALPSFAEWQEAFAGATARRYPFGDRFRAKWMKSCYARPRAIPEPVLRFPVDESPYGIFDLCGGAREWVGGFYDEGRGLRRICGGSWAQAKPAFFERYGEGYEPTVALGDSGFRLVLREGPP